MSSELFVPAADIVDFVLFSVKDSYDIAVVYRDIVFKELAVVLNSPFAVCALIMRLVIFADIIESYDGGLFDLILLLKRDAEAGD